MFVAVWKRPPLGFVGAWWFVILAPTSSIAPIVDLAFEHRTYLSLIAPVTLLVMGAYELLGLLGRRVAASAATVSAWRLALCVVVVSILTTLTLLRNHDYRSELALWRDVRFKSPENSRAHYNYGVYLQIEGTDETVSEAIREYKEALKLTPSYPGAHLNIAALAAWKGRYEEAVDEYRAELVNQPTLVQAIVGLADALIHLNRHDEARPYIEQALQLDPRHAEAKALYEQLPATVPTPT
jgi:tetratricopeptide (TPR) repeat protein